VENNLTEIANKLKQHLEGFTNELPNLTNVLKSMIESNPDLAKEYAKALKDADINAKIEKLKKDIKSANNTFRK
jgi:ElaB/YqjD/DUF883 family membrane-anchored ribosome-binding protein